MRSFAIEESNSPIPALLAALLSAWFAPIEPSQPSDLLSEGPEFLHLNPEKDSCNDMIVDYSEAGGQYDLSFSFVAH